MSAPTPGEIQQSLSKLQQGLPLFQKDLFHIAWGFAFHPNQDRLLMEIHIYNNKLAETLLVFRKILREAAAAADLEPAIDALCLHYVVNTDGPIPELEGEDPFDVFEAAARYANARCVDVSRGANNVSILHVNDKDVICPEWDAVPGWSAAWSLRQAGPVINRARYGRNDVLPSVAFGFDEHAEAYTLPNAMTLADLSHLAYFAPAFVEKQLRRWGYDSFRWVEDTGADTQAFVAEKDRHLVVCFRGTSSGTDALVDVKFLKTGAFGGRGRVHSGFQGALDAVWEPLQTAVHALGAGKKLFVCGHSLGAALAQLAAHRFALGALPVAGVYVYGSPRIGNREFMEGYNELLEAKTFLHINHQDIVTQLPPALLGFRRLGGPPRQFDSGHFISMPASEPADEVQEMRFEALDEKSREQIQQNTEDVQRSLRAATRFLTTPPHRLHAGTYGTDFESGAVDDHSMDQYLFKLGCAIVDGEWQRMGETKRTNHAG